MILPFDLPHLLPHLLTFADLLLILLQQHLDLVAHLHVQLLQLLLFCLQLLIHLGHVMSLKLPAQLRQLFHRIVYLRGQELAQLKKAL